MPGLYIHVPFCTKKCHYCDFVIAIASQDGRQMRYLDALEKEAQHTSPEYSGKNFDTVYLGGGTPSTLSHLELERLLGIIRGNFKIQSQAEITFEANPNDIHKELAEKLSSLGVTRISLGAQTFNDNSLSQINRTHSAQQIEKAVQILRKARFKNINMDLILSLPGETWDTVKLSLERAIELDPEHISLYELCVEEKTVFGDLAKRGKLDLPSEDAQFETLAKARQMLKDAGYDHYELLNYSKIGFRSKHNLLYWANQEYLGLGPGAWAYDGKTRYRLANSYEQYLNKVESGVWERADEDVLDDVKRARESLLLALRLTEGAKMSQFEQVLKESAADVESLIERGFLIEENEQIRLSDRGQFFAESVFCELSKA